jgi:DNA invertase Pin-like site-specific DNA recombinase
VPIDDALDAVGSGGADIERAILAEQVQKVGRLQDRRVVRLIVDGATYRDVAAELHISKAYARKVWQRVVERLRDGVVE